MFYPVKWLKILKIFKFNYLIKIEAIFFTIFILVNLEDIFGICEFSDHLLSKPNLIDGLKRGPTVVDLNTNERLSGLLLAKVAILGALVDELIDAFCEHLLDLGLDVLVGLFETAIAQNDRFHGELAHGSQWQRLELEALLVHFQQCHVLRRQFAL